MIAATRAIVATVPRREDSAREKPAEREASGHASAESAPASRGETPRNATAFATTLPMAPFVAQLIATYQALPQTRARNRAEPADAVLAYRRANRSQG